MQLLRRGPRGPPSTMARHVCTPHAPPGGPAASGEEGGSHGERIILYPHRPDAPAVLRPWPASEGRFYRAAGAAAVAATPQVTQSPSHLSEKDRRRAARQRIAYADFEPAGEESSAGAGEGGDAVAGAQQPRRWHRREYSSGACHSQHAAFGRLRRRGEGEGRSGMQWAKDAPRLHPAARLSLPSPNEPYVAADAFPPIVQKSEPEACQTRAGPYGSSTS